MKLIRTRFVLIVLSLIMLGVSTISSSAYAFDPFGNLCGNSNAGGSSVCTDRSKGGTDPLVGPGGVIPKVVEVTAIVAGIAAVFVLVLSGWTFITAQGEPGKVKQAQEMAKSAIVGMIVVSVAASIVSFVLTKL